MTTNDATNFYVLGENPYEDSVAWKKASGDVEFPLGFEDFIFWLIQKGIRMEFRLILPPACEAIVQANEGERWMSVSCQRPGGHGERHIHRSKDIYVEWNI